MVAICLLAAIPIHAADQRAAAKSLAASGDYAGAARCYRETAAHYRAIGDQQAALIFDSKADQYEPQLVGYRDRAASADELSQFYTGAKAEPLYGCYIGVNCFQDPFVDRSFESFCKKTGKQHALLYNYARYCRIDDYLLSMTKPGGPWLQAACEPDCGLQAVQPGAALENWARSLGALKRPLFLRWGSEMNGDWVRWHGNPSQYIQKWRLVHDAMERLAPNVVMVWCPNATPVPQIDRYYPGDQYVDWVGVNSYVVAIHNNDPGQSAAHENPADLFSYIYRTYAARKPMMICETGVTHHSLALGRPDYAFAKARIGQLYGCLPRLYPRLKAICYYDVNNLKGTATGRPFNNYLLTDNAQVLDAYRRAIAPGYFLSGVQGRSGSLPPYTERLADGQTLQGMVHVSAWAKSWVIAPVVQYKLDGQVLAHSETCGTYDYQLDCSQLRPGPHTLTLTMLDKVGGRVLKTVSYAILTAA